MKGTSWITIVLVMLIGSAVGIAGGTFFAVVLPSMMATHTGVTDFFHNPFGGKRYVRLLMIGEDDTSKRNSNHNGLSDTLVVMAIDCETKDIRAISIPRDTRVEIPGHGICKINSAHVYGGPELTRQVLTDMLGVPIDYYIKTNTTGLRELVDLVGGVYIVVDKNMHYTDRRGKLYIDLHAGPQKQLLNGREAEGYVRFRHDAFGDSGNTIKDGKKVSTGRIVRQQYFLRALANRILSLPTKRERAKVLEQAYEKKYIVSDLNLKDWDSLSEFFKDFDPEAAKMDVLPGTPGNIHGASYWLPDTEQLTKVVAVNLLFQDPPATVEVLNGSGISGMASKVAEKLKGEGYEVMRTDNAPKSNYPTSCVIAHSDNKQPAERIAALVGSSDIKVDKTSTDVDITVIVGRNYTE